MTLQEYLAQKEENGLAFARRTQIPASTVYRILAGTQPDWKTMEAILKATNQQVTPNDFAGGLLAMESPEAAAE